MIITALKELVEGERRCALSIDSVKKFAALGADIVIESGAGEGSSITDTQFTEAGATMRSSDDRDAMVESTDILLCLNQPEKDVTDRMKEGAHVVGMLAPLSEESDVQWYADHGLHAYAMELLPRISRAQSMDVLSSQSNLAGYRAVIEAAQAHSKIFPMMMTAAGTIPPAKVLVLGAGVAGLQAIATAKRLGAMVSAFDVRPVVKEQVESLGAKFVEVPNDTAEGEDSGGYAREMSEEYKQKQATLIHDTALKSDVIITTALIPGKPAPELIKEETVRAMKHGSVIVDLAAAAGGNCKLTEEDKVITQYGVKLLGYSDLPSRAASDATPLYARNLYNFVSTLMLSKDGALEVQWDDELIQGTLLTKDGEVVHAMLKG